MISGQISIREVTYMDRIIRATAAEGFIKMAVVDGRDLVQRAREIHRTAPTSTAALGRTLCAASLLGNMLKEDDAGLTIRVQGDGPAGQIIAVSDHEGNVRGLMENPGADLPLRSDGKLDVGGAVGHTGMLTISRDLGLREPYIGSVALVSGEIAEDVTAYLLESEQVPSACALGVLVDTDTSVKAAGGFIVQLMPGAEEKLIGTLEENIFLMDQVTTILDEDGAEELFAQVLKGMPYHITEQTPVAYQCACSRERFAHALTTIDRADLVDMAEAGENAEIVCDFCGTKYVFTQEDLRALAFPPEDANE